MKAYEEVGERALVLNPYDERGERVILLQNGAVEEPLVPEAIVPFELRTVVLDSHAVEQTRIQSSQYLGAHVLASNPDRNDLLVVSMNAKNMANGTGHLKADIESLHLMRSALAYVFLTNGVSFALAFYGDDSDRARLMNEAQALARPAQDFSDRLGIHLLDVLAVTPDGYYSAGDAGDM